MYHIADKSYIAVKPETTENVAVIPNIFLPVEEVEVESDLGLTPDRRMQGNEWESQGMSFGERTHSGRIKFWGDPETIGYLLDMCMKLGTETGNGTDGYLHPFTPDQPIQSYTIEIAKGDYVQRFYGVKGASLTFMFEDGKLKCELNIEAAGEFSAVSLQTALSAGVSTNIDLKQEYDLYPTAGLVVGDVLVIGVGTANEEAITIATINANGFRVTKAAAVVNAHSAGEVVYLKKQTPTIATLPPPLYMGDVLVGFGATAAAALTAAGSKATATPVYDLNIEYNNNMFNAHGTQSRGPAKILPQQRSLRVELKQLMDNPTQVQKWREIEKQAIAIIMRGRTINAATPTYSYLKIVLHKAQLETNGEPLVPGEYINDDQAFVAAYDPSDAKAITVELFNTKASY